MTSTTRLLGVTTTHQVMVGVTGAPNLARYPGQEIFPIRVLVEYRVDSNDEGGTDSAVTAQVSGPRQLANGKPGKATETVRYYGDETGLFRYNDEAHVTKGLQSWDPPQWLIDLVVEHAPQEG